MIPEQRRAYIITQLEKGFAIEIDKLARELSVSEMTVRRDLRQLEREGLLRRVHGGAISSQGRSFEPPLILRSNRNRSAKQAIARRAAELITTGDCIALDIGSTTLEIAYQLIHRNNLTVITPSLPIAALLSENAGIRLIVPGGIIRIGERSMIGELAQKAFENLFVDKLFLGVGGIDAEAGLTEFNWDDTLVKKAMIRSAKQTIVVADSSKFNRVAFARIAYLREVQSIITNAQPPPNLRTAIEEANVHLDVAD